MAFVEGALWKQKKTMTGFKWKKRWSDVKPSEKAKPKHVYNIPKCTVREIRTNKPYAFSVTDNGTGDTIIFAATKVTEYDSWLSILINEEALDDSSVAVTDDDLRSGNEHESAIDLAAKYFERHCATRNSFQLEVDARKFPGVVRLLGLQLSENAIESVLNKLQTPGGTITLKEFCTWLNQHTTGEAEVGDSRASVSSDASRLSRRIRRAKNAAKIGRNEVLRLNHAGSSWLNMPEPTLLSGATDTKLLDLKRKADVVAALFEKVPDIGEVVRSWAAPNCADGQSWTKNWNDMHQRLQEDVGAISLGNQVSEDIHSLFSLAALHGAFLNAAASGKYFMLMEIAMPHLNTDVAVQTVVDEYSLPHHMKTVQMLNVESGNAYTDEERDEDVYVTTGLILRLMGARCSDRDKAPTDTRLKFVISSDDIMRKVAGNEVRALLHTHHVLCSLNDSDDTMSLSELAKPSVLLTTLIDYCGLRFEVFAPVELDEEHTLVYGYSATEEIFVNANPVLQTIIPVLGDRLNVAVSKKPMLTSSVTLDQREATDMTQTFCEILSKDLQLHICDDNRVYLLNFSGVIPPDLPRPQSNDIHTRKLRPEYVSEYSDGAIPAEAVRYDLENQGGGGPAGPNSCESEEIEKEDESRSAQRSLRPTVILKPLEPVVNWIRAASMLREDHIPDIVLKLDTMTIVPVDSYGFTEFLHSHGVNIRYIGEIYARSKTPHVKELVLCEAISRSCKTVLNQSLRKISRRGRAETLIAEQRKRSRPEHYVHHQGTVLRAKLTAIVDMFNVIFGYGEETELFWNEILPAILFEKFELSFPCQFKRSLYVHMPQLFHAVEYHTGVMFRRAASSVAFASESTPQPFVEEDIVDILHATKFRIAYPGLFYTVDSLAEAFLACNMYADAVKAFKIRLSMHEICRNQLEKPSTKMKHTSTLISYNLALCYYLSGKLEAASAVLRAELDDCRKSSPLTARLVTLLMCVDYRAGRMIDSMKHYETAREMYIECLGPRHPMLCLMYSTLADMYFGSDALNHAHVMTLKAVDFCEHFVGETHLLFGACAYKLGVVLVKLGAYKDSEAVLQKSLAVYAALSNRGAEFSNERALCLHGLAVVQNALENVDGALNFAVQSLALSTAEDKYITTQAVNCILLLAELHEKSNLLGEAADLYADAWDIVCTYPKDYDVFRMLLALAARIMSTHINSLPLHARMLLESVAADVDDYKKREWDIGCLFVSDKLLQKSPIGYIGDLMKELIEKSNPVLSSMAFVNQASVVGVPCAAKKRGETEFALDTDEAGTGVSNAHVPIELQVSVILKMILELT